MATKSFRVFAVVIFGWRARLRRTPLPVCVLFLVVLRGHGGFQAAAALPQFALVAVQGHLLQGGGGGQRGGSLHFSVDAAPKRSCLVLVVTSVAGGVDVLHFLCCIRSLNVVYGFGRRNGGKLSVVKLL